MEWREKFGGRGMRSVKRSFGSPLPRQRFTPGSFWPGAEPATGEGTRPCLLRLQLSLNTTEYEM